MELTKSNIGLLLTVNKKVRLLMSYKLGIMRMAQPKPKNLATLLAEVAGPSSQCSSMRFF